MNFEVFNRQTEKKQAVYMAIVSIDSSNGIGYLNKPAVEHLGLKRGGKIEILQFGTQWFITRSKSVYGFLLSLLGTYEDGGLRFCSKHTINQITKGEEVKLRFYLHKTNHIYQGNVVYELLPKKA